MLPAVKCKACKYYVKGACRLYERVLTKASDKCPDFTTAHRPT